MEDKRTTMALAIIDKTRSLIIQGHWHKEWSPRDGAALTEYATDALVDVRCMLQYDPAPFLWAVRTGGTHLCYHNAKGKEKWEAVVHNYNNTLWYLMDDEGHLTVADAEAQAAFFADVPEEGKNG